LSGAFETGQRTAFLHSPREGEGAGATLAGEDGSGLKSEPRGPTKSAPTPVGAVPALSGSEQRVPGLPVLSKMKRCDLCRTLQDRGGGQCECGSYVFSPASDAEGIFVRLGAEDVDLPLEDPLRSIRRIVRSFTCWLSVLAGLYLGVAVAGFVQD